MEGKELSDLFFVQQDNSKKNPELAWLQHEVNFRFTGFIRHGFLSLQGTQPIDPPTSANAFCSNGAAFSWNASGQRTLSIQYNPIHDVGPATIIHRRIKYETRYYLSASVHISPFEQATDVHATVGGVIQKDGVIAMSGSAGAAMQAATYTLQVGPVAFNVYAPNTTALSDSGVPTVPNKIDDSNAVPHIAGSTVYYGVSINGFLGGDVASGLFSKAGSIGFLFAHTLTAK